MSGLIENRSAAELEREEQERANNDAALRQNEPSLLSLVSHVKDRWEAARQAKEPIYARMIEALRQREGEYDQSKLNAIKKQGGSEIYMMLTDEKCNAFESWAEDILLPPDDHPYGIKGTPVPDIAPQLRMEIEQQAQQMAMQMVQQEAAQMQQAGQQVTNEQLAQMVEQKKQQVMLEVEDQVQQEAKKEHRELEKYIEDRVVESAWRDALSESISDLATYPAAIMKGPFVTREPKLQWGEDGRPIVEVGFQINFERVSPFDIYPSPNSKDIDGGYLFEYHEMTTRDLAELRGVEGYDTDAIDNVIREAKDGGLNNWLWRMEPTERDTLQGRHNTWADPDKKVPALQFWGDVQGLKLLEWGMDPEEIDDPMDTYQAEVWLIGNWAIKAELNGDLLGRKPYYKASFRRRNGQFWGTGLPELIKDSQDACNAAARNLINNMAIASGPQVGVDISSMPRGSDVTDLYPWKIWQFDLSKDTFNRDPIWFFQPNPMVDSLMGVYDRFSAEADNKSGIPRYSYGAGGGGGASDTASGFSMMMSNASRGVKKVVANIDRGIVQRSIKRLYQHLMLNDPKLWEIYQGDIEIVARGSTELMAKEQQQVRRNELLNIVLSSEVSQQIVGIPGIAEILREVVKGLGIGLENIMPTQEQMRQQELKRMVQEQMMQQQAQGNQPPAKKGSQTALSGAKAGGADANTVQ